VYLVQAFSKFFLTKSSGLINQTRIAGNSNKNDTQYVSTLLQKCFTSAKAPYLLGFFPLFSDLIRSGEPASGVKAEADLLPPLLLFENVNLGLITC